MMMDVSDAFIALSGGIRTLEEIFQLASWAQLNIHKKPIGLLNVDGFYDNLLSFLDFAMGEQFISPLSRRILLVAGTPEELLDKMVSFVPKLDPFLESLNWISSGDEKKRKRE